MTTKIYWGIDGCKGGWIALGLEHGGTSHYAYVTTIPDFWDRYGVTAQRILIDMPIGLSSDADGRLVDAAARDILQNRRSSVFSVPTRDAIMLGGEHGFTDENYKIACDINREIEGKAFSKQGWNISAKIYEVDTFLRDHISLKDSIVETHPEVLFWALNNQQPMRYSKKTGLGFMERVELLEQYQANALDLIREIYEVHRRVLVDDDIVDALACAVCARMQNLTTIPQTPKLDAHGLPMQVVYPHISNND